MTVKPIHILLVEDNDADATLLECELEDSPFGPFTMSRRESLGDATAVLSAENFDVVLLDLGLPDSQGLETFQRLRGGAAREIPIVVLTGLNDQAQGIRALQEGAADYLVKSGNRDSLRSIRYAIERRRITDALRSTEHRLAMAVDLAELGIFEWNLKTRQIHLFHHCARLLGLAEDDTTATLDVLLRRVVSEDQPEFIAALERSVATGERYQHQYRVVWADGSEHWIEARGKTVHDCLIGTLMDISHRRIMEESARERASELTRLADARLTPREISLMQMLAQGMPSKMIAMNLKISIRTVSKHRAHLMAKTRARNAADLARISTLAGIFAQKT